MFTILEPVVLRKPGVPCVECRLSIPLHYSRGGWKGGGQPGLCRSSCSLQEGAPLRPGLGMSRRAGCRRPMWRGHRLRPGQPGQWAWGPSAALLRAEGPGLASHVKAPRTEFEGTLVLWLMLLVKRKLCEIWGHTANAPLAWPLCRETWGRISPSFQRGICWPHTHEGGCCRTG